MRFANCNLIDNVGDSNTTTLRNWLSKYIMFRDGPLMWLSRSGSLCCGTGNASSNFWTRGTSNFRSGPRSTTLSMGIEGLTSLSELPMLVSWWSWLALSSGGLQLSGVLRVDPVLRNRESAATSAALTGRKGEEAWCAKEGSWCVASCQEASEMGVREDVWGIGRKKGEGDDEIFCGMTWRLRLGRFDVRPFVWAGSDTFSLRLGGLVGGTIGTRMRIPEERPWTWVTIARQIGHLARAVRRKQDRQTSRWPHGKSAMSVWASMHTTQSSRWDCSPSLSFLCNSFWTQLFWRTACLSAAIFGVSIDGMMSRFARLDDALKIYVGYIYGIVWITELFGTQRDNDL